MTDTDIIKAAQSLSYIEHHEREIKDLERRIVEHREQIAKERARIEKLKVDA